MQVMAWELLTGSRIYGEHATMADVVACLTQQRPLPTERPLTEAERRAIPGTAFRASIVAMLHRKPHKRPSIAHVVQTWTDVFRKTSAVT